LFGVLKVTDEQSRIRTRILIC